MSAPQYIGAIRGPGVVIADMTAVLRYSELSGRCLAIMRLGKTVVDGTDTELLSSSSSTTTTTATPTTTGWDGENQH